MADWLTGYWRVGPIGICCPDECPLLGFVSLFAPAVVRGNTIVIVPSEKHPLAALDFYQVLLVRRMISFGCDDTILSSRLSLNERWKALELP